MNLSALIRDRVSKAVAIATPAIPATEGLSEGATVATIATIAVANPAESITEAIRQADWAELIATVNDCCDARRDSDEQRRALLVDCCRLPVEEWLWHITYFHGQAELWRAVTAHSRTKKATD